MLKLTKKRFTNKRKPNISSIRRKLLVSRRKRQVGGEMITLPKKLEFRVYMIPRGVVPEKFINICPEKWHEITGDDRPKFLHVTATTSSEIRADSTMNLFNDILLNYEFNISDDSDNKHVGLTKADMLNKLVNSRKEINSSNTIKTLRNIIRTYYNHDNSGKILYISSINTTSVIAWIDDIDNANCCIMGRYTNAKSCENDTDSTLEHSMRGDSCSNT